MKQILMSILLLLTINILPVAYCVSVNQYQTWTLCADFKTNGELDATAITCENEGPLTLKANTSSGTWTSNAFRVDYPVTRVVPSWNAITPPGTWVETRLSVEVNGHWSKWFSMGKWAFDESEIRRASVKNQKSSDGDLQCDTFDTANKTLLTAYKLQIDLHTIYGTITPSVTQVSATAFDATGSPSATTSNTTVDSDIELKVTQYSQMTHHNEYPLYGGGGQAWCSPTSTQMAAEFWGIKPSTSDLQTLTDSVFTEHGKKDGSVVWAALHTYDWSYAGTGNWAYNAAYAGYYGLNASVRRYGSLLGVECWIKEGVPVIASISWDSTASNRLRHMDNAYIKGTNGHLLLVRGFTRTGDVIVNDPANVDNDSVRRVYKRDQFEYNWQYASHGIVYIYKSYQHSSQCQ